MAVAARERVLKKRAAHSHLSSRTVYSAVDLPIGWDLGPACPPLRMLPRPLSGRLLLLLLTIPRYFLPRLRCRRSWGHYPPAATGIIHESS